jgi:predicted permease
MVELRDRNQSFTDIAGYFAFYGTGDFSLTGQGEPERLTAIPVSEKFFPVLGIQPEIGRQFTAVECAQNGPPVAILSHGFWERRFGLDPRIVGKTLRLNDRLFTVVGVMLAAFDFGAIFSPGTNADLFYPFPLTKGTDRMGNTMAIVGRLKPGATLGRAQAEAEILGDQISNEDRNRNSLHPKLTFLAEHVSGQIRPALLILASAVGVVMLIVCANLSNLMLARTAARQKEMAIRAALGAGRRRLVRQLLTESLLLTGCGALLGMILAFAATRGIAHLTAFNLPLLSSVRIDARVLAFTVIVAVVTGLTLGLAPVWQVSVLRLNASLGQRGSGGSQEQNWLRGTLVVSEIAFACVLLVGAGLLVRSLMKVLDVHLGFRPQSAAAIRIDPNSQYSTNARQLAYLDDALRRVRGITGVEAAGLADALPLGKNRTRQRGQLSARSVPYGIRTHHYRWLPDCHGDDFEAGPRPYGARYARWRSGDANQRDAGEGALAGAGSHWQSHCGRLRQRTRGRGRRWRRSAHGARKSFRERDVYPDAAVWGPRFVGSGGALFPALDLAHLGR